MITEGPFDSNVYVTRDYFNVSGEPLDPRIEQVNQIAYGVVAPVIIAVGIIGNLLTVFILRLPQFRGVTYTYFLMLAVSDLVSLLFSISVFYHLTHETTLRYSTAVWYSFFEGFFANVFLSTSVFIVICVTVDRYYSVCRPVKFRTVHNEFFAKSMIAGSFAVSVLVWLPVCFMKSPKEYGDCDFVYSSPPDDKLRWVACMEIPEIPTDDWYFIYCWIRQTIVTFIPIVILIVLNILTLKAFIRLKRRRREMARKSICVISISHLSQSIDGRSHSDQNLINLLTAVMATFFFTMVPVGIFNALYTDSHYNDFSYQVFRAVANNLEILNHALNFYMYIMCSEPIRKALKNYFCFCCGRSTTPTGIAISKIKIKKFIICCQQSVVKVDFAETRNPDMSERPKLKRIFRTLNEVQPQHTILEDGSVSADSSGNVDNYHSDIFRCTSGLTASVDKSESDQPRQCNRSKMPQFHNRVTFKSVEVNVKYERERNCSNSAPSYDIEDTKT